MAYATRSDIEAIYQPELLVRIAYDRAAGEVDDNLVAAALNYASALIDSRLSQRYTLPLDPVPQIINGYCVDLAIYRMALTRDKLTQEMRQRYEDAVADLRDIAAGKAGLGNPTINPDTGSASVSGGLDVNNARARICISRRRG